MARAGPPAGRPIITYTSTSTWTSRSARGSSDLARLNEFGETVELAPREARRGVAVRRRPPSARPMPSCRRAAAAQGRPACSPRLEQSQSHSPGDERAIMLSETITRIILVFTSTILDIARHCYQGVKDQFTEWRYANGQARS